MWLCVPVGCAECGAGWFVQEYDWFSKLTGCAADGALEGAKGGVPAKLEEGTDPAMLGVLPWTYGTPLNVTQQLNGEKNGKDAIARFKWSGNICQTQLVLLAWVLWENPWPTTYSKQVLRLLFIIVTRR